MRHSVREIQNMMRLKRCQKSDWNTFIQHHTRQANQRHEWLQRECYLKGGVETATDGNIPPALTRRIKRVLRLACNLAAVLMTSRPVDWSIHYDWLASLGNNVRRRAPLDARLVHAANHSRWLSRSTRSRSFTNTCILYLCYNRSILVYFYCWLPSQPQSMVVPNYMQACITKKWCTTKKWADLRTINLASPVIHRGA